MRCQILRFTVFPAVTTMAAIFLWANITAGAEPCTALHPPARRMTRGPVGFSSLHTIVTIRRRAKRITQYSPLPNVYVTEDPTYQESGFHYTQQILLGPNGSVDGYHLIQSWGRGDQIRPYGEWEYPYRAGGTSLWTLGESARPVDVAVRFVAESVRPGAAAESAVAGFSVRSAAYSKQSVGCSNSLWELYSPYSPAMPGAGYGQTPMLGRDLARCRRRQDPDGRAKAWSGWASLAGQVSNLSIDKRRFRLT